MEDYPCDVTRYADSRRLLSLFYQSFYCRNFSIIAHIGTYCISMLLLMFNELGHRSRKVNSGRPVSFHLSHLIPVVDTQIPARLLEVHAFA